jgi:hypothetical protein
VDRKVSFAGGKPGKIEEKERYEQIRGIKSRQYHYRKATHIDGDIAELRPAHGMVHVVFAKVVFG